jgi:DNA-binding GntR family transcriptional regulator
LAGDSELSKKTETATPPRGKRRAGRPKGTGSRRVYDSVRESILKLDLAPGATLDEAGLEQAFGVSRTPVREALIRLASDGLITLLPNRGARVASLDVSDMPAMFEALELAQRATLRWAAKRRSDADLETLEQTNGEFAAAAKSRDVDRMTEANRAFHVAIGRACRNKYIAELYETQLAISLRLARLVFAQAPLTGRPYRSYYDEVVRQHAAMVAAIDKKDARTADRLARDHADLFRSRVMEHMQSSLAGDLPMD